MTEASGPAVPPSSNRLSDTEELNTSPDSFLAQHVPGVASIRRYQWSRWLRLDLVAAVSVAALLVPESLGYASVAGLPPEVALYAAPFALLAYALLGRSSVLVVATSSSTAAVSASVIADVNAGGGSDTAVALSAALAVFTGLIFIAAGLARLGWVANFMSKTVIEGFIIGLSINIIIGQMDSFLGIEVTGESAMQSLGDALGQIGDWDRPTLIVGAASLALLFVLERFVEKLPAALTVVVLAVLYIAIVDPSDIAIVGDIPQGLPEFGIPEFSSSDVAGLIAGALAVALIGFSEGYGAASSYARKHGDRLDNNQEFIALGVANAGAGLSSGMVVGGSLSKTAANDSSNAKSQLSGIGMAVLVVLTLLFLAPFFEKLPEATLAAIVIHALWHSADPRKLRRVLRTSRSEFLLAVVVLVVVLVLDTMPAIVLGVVISLGLLVYQVSFPQTSELVRNEDTGAFERRDGQGRPAATNGVVIYRFDAPLIYANASRFTRAAEDLVNAAQPPATVLIVDCEEMFGTDVTGAEELGDLVEGMQDRGVVVALSRVHSNVLETLERSGVIDRLGSDRIFKRTQDAVAALPGSVYETPPPAAT